MSRFDTDVANIPLTDLRVDRTAQSHCTLGSAGQNLQGERSVIEITAAGPMLLILIAFRHRPYFIAAVVTILEWLGPQRNHLPLQQGVDVQEIMAAESDLDEPPTNLRNNLQPHPGIGHLLGLPTQVICRMHLAA